MAVIDARTWMQHLSIDECWQKLTRSSVGRIGVLVDSAPEIYPVNFVVHERSILFRTDAGSKLRGVDRSPAVCFEVDHINPDDRSGWSVLVKGRAHELTTSDELQGISEIGLDFWPLGDKAHWIRVRPIEVTGRRIHRR